MPLSTLFPLAGHCPLGFKAVQGAVASTNHATARVSEVITQTLTQHLPGCKQKGRLGKVFLFAVPARWSQ